MKRAISICISIIPVNLIRIFLYRVLLGYKIDYTSKISMFNAIVCNDFIGNSIIIGSFNRIQVDAFIGYEGAHIKNLNKFLFVKKIVLKSRSFIGSSNSIIGTREYFSPYEDAFLVEIGEKSIITNNHYLDCAGKIIIGSNVVFGGVRTEVWTHGFDSKRTMIVGDVNIGNDIYIGSGCKILQGVKVCDKVSIGSGTIVSKNIIDSGFYVSSQLIKKAEIIDYSEHFNVIKYDGTNFVRKK